MLISLLSLETQCRTNENICEKSILVEWPLPNVVVIFIDDSTKLINSILKSLVVINIHDHRIDDEFFCIFSQLCFYYYHQMFVSINNFVWIILQAADSIISFLSIVYLTFFEIYGRCNTIKCKFCVRYF